MDIGVTIDHWGHFAYSGYQFWRHVNAYSGYYCWEHFYVHCDNKNWGHFNTYSGYWCYHRLKGAF